jgi:hypothetical protein
MARDAEQPFAELPTALVQEMLNHTKDLSGEIATSLQEVRTQRMTWRTQLENNRLLKREAELSYVSTPTTCGVDGAFAIERLLSTDIIAAAAVAVEGLTPPSDTRFWPEPYHQVYFETEAHDADSGSVARAVMMGMELELAVNAPHDIVFLDGSLTTPLIYFNQALSKAENTPHLQVSHYLLSRIKGFLSAYQIILKAQRTDKCWVAVPKYTARREIGQHLHWPESYDDRAILSNVLYPGEFVGPITLQAPDQLWHLNTKPVKAEERQEADTLAQDITYRLTAIRVVYYRPFPWMPALRLEMSAAIADTTARLASVMHAIKHQCGSASMMEPYPLYMADRMVKSLSTAISTFRQVTSQHLAETYPGEINDVFLSLHGYRTESGR